jgi:CRP-like cAMP-binding protein
VKIKRLRKRQYFIQESDICRYIGFITKGAAKTYSKNEREQESILSFSMENDWLTDMENFLFVKELSFHIEVLEDLEMIILDRDQLFSLMAAIAAMDELICRFQIKQLIEPQKSINASLSITAEERYANLLTIKPAYA